MKIDKIDKFDWHDGVLGEVQIAPKERSTDGFAFIINALLYPTPDDRMRKPYRFTFSGTGLLSLCCDFHELRMNRGAGNISYGYVKEQSKAKAFWLHLVDGHITFKFKSVKIETLS
jgi:hypothetical protein